MTTDHRLQQLFDEPIEQITVLDPGYSGHASDVWLVKTAAGECVVRSSRLKDAPTHEFWWGCYDLFGIDPRSMHHFAANAAMLGTIADIPAPRIHKHQLIEGREYLVVEKMNGQTFGSFATQSDAFLHQLGTWLARVHERRYDYYGNLAGDPIGRLESFHTHLARTMQQLVELDCTNDTKIKDQLDAMLHALDVLPVPAHFCPIFIDLDSSQFLMLRACCPRSWMLKLMR
ncbi:phosphotransferase [Paenibacillus sp. BC26]|uniref:phosphotransferase n=1 Tax=Paenibacillus sp. BC26 TaxID=1881032 RepID=UPI000A4FF762|nr:phosphotransferase [Paenibacillus sp. BC26]